MSTAGDESTVWTMSPSGFVERGSMTSITDLSGLPPGVQRALGALSVGRSEPVGAIVHQIAAFFVDAEDARAEIPLAEALDWYVTNMLPPGFAA